MTGFGVSVTWGVSVTERRPRASAWRILAQSLQREDPRQPGSWQRDLMGLLISSEPFRWTGWGVRVHPGELIWGWS